MGEEPKWSHVFYLGDVFGDSTMKYEARRDEITRRLRMQWFYIAARAGGDNEVVEIVDRMADSATHEEFDEHWFRFYDWCDKQRVYVDINPRFE